MHTLKEDSFTCKYNFLNKKKGIHLYIISRLQNVFIGKKNTD